MATEEDPTPGYERALMGEDLPSEGVPIGQRPILRPSDDAGDDGTVLVEPKLQYRTTMLEMQRRVYEWTYRKGWEPDDARTFGDECALIHSEVSEALEAFRKWGFDEKLLFENPSGFALLPPDDANAQNWEAAGIVGKPEGVASEFADVLIRLLHYCTVHGIDLEHEFEKKMAYNETREIRHGGKRL